MDKPPVTYPLVLLMGVLVVLVILNNAAMNVGVHIFLCVSIMISFLLAMYVRVGFLGHMVILHLTFWRTTRLFFLFKAAAAAAAAKSLQSCPTLCDPIDGSPPGSPVPGILQASWSGLPFPSPMHESEKSKWSRTVVSDSSRLHGLQPTRLLRPWDFPGKSTGVGCHCLLRI